MQVAVVHRQAAAQHQPRAYSLSLRAALLCGARFPAHLSAWREALLTQRRDGTVPVSYLGAMRKIVAAEAAAGALESDDAVASAVAIAELQTEDALQIALLLLQDLAALGDRHAELLRLALCVASRSPATLAQARVDLLALSGVGNANERAAVACLLGELYLARAGSPVNTAIAYRYFMAAAEEGCPAAAAAHFHLGLWYAAERTQADLLLANHHFERGAEHGCAESLRALSELHQDSDGGHYAQELLELAEMADGRPPPPRVRALA